MGATREQVFAWALGEIARMTRQIRILDRERKPLDCTSQVWLEELGRKVDAHHAEEEEREKTKREGRW